MEFQSHSCLKSEDVKRRKKQKWRRKRVRGREKESYAATLFAKGSWKALTSWGTLRERRKGGEVTCYEGKERSGYGVRRERLQFPCWKRNRSTMPDQPAPSLLWHCILLSTPLFALPPYHSLFHFLLIVSRVQNSILKFFWLCLVLVRLRVRFNNFFLIFIDNIAYWK